MNCFVGEGRRPLQTQYRPRRLNCFVGEGPSLDQVTLEMFHISKMSFCQKCDFWQNPCHVVARCTLVQR